jgi:hypothetical protein
MECCIQISDEVTVLFELDNDIIYVRLNGSPDEVPKNPENASLVCGSRIF